MLAFVPVQADVPCLHVMVMQKLGQELALSFGVHLGRSVSFHCGIVQFALSGTKLLFVLQTCLSADVRTVCHRLTAVLVAHVLVTLDHLTGRHLEAASVAVGMYFGRWYVCSALECCLGYFWGNEGHSIEASS